MYECFHCGERAVIWDGDFTFEDYGYEGDGVINTLHCENCGAEITYAVAIEEDNNGTDSDGSSGH